MQWIKENISEFGGNPENITIFGESAGSISNLMLMVIPGAKNLFNKAIPQSGNSFMFNTPEKSGKLAEIYMNLGNAKNMSDMMKKSADELRELYVKVINSRFSDSATDYLPTCDGKFLPTDPFKALKRGAARGIKILTGTTAGEWRYWFSYFENFFEVFRENPKNFSPTMQKYTAQPPQKIYKDWLKNRPDNLENFEEFVNNLDWRVGQELTAEYQSNFDDVYFYLFSEESAEKNLKSCHAVDLPYTFNVGDHIIPNPKQNLVKIIQKSWAAFAATGNPNNEFIPHWEKYSAQNRQTMELNSKKCILHKDLNTENLNSLRYVYES